MDASVSDECMVISVSEKCVFASDGRIRVLSGSEGRTEASPLDVCSDGFMDSERSEFGRVLGVRRFLVRAEGLVSSSKTSGMHPFSKVSNSKKSRV